MIFNMGGGSENLTEQMTQLDTILTEIEESLLGKGSGANITPETVLAGYTGYKNKELVTGEYDVSNLVPENVREGMSFGAGLIGAMSEGVDLSWLGCTNGICEIGSITPTSLANNITINHALSVKPAFLYMWVDDEATVFPAYVIAQDKTGALIKPGSSALTSGASIATATWSTTQVKISNSDWNFGRNIKYNYALYA